MVYFHSALNDISSDGKFSWIDLKSITEPSRYLSRQATRSDIDHPNDISSITSQTVSKLNKLSSTLLSDFKKKMFSVDAEKLISCSRVLTDVALLINEAISVKTLEHEINFYSSTENIFFF